MLKCFLLPLLFFSLTCSGVGLELPNPLGIAKKIESGVNSAVTSTLTPVLTPVLTSVGLSPELTNTLTPVLISALTSAALPPVPAPDSSAKKIAAALTPQITKALTNAKLPSAITTRSTEALTPVITAAIIEAKLPPKTTSILLEVLTKAGSPSATPAQLQLPIPAPNSSPPLQSPTSTLGAPNSSIPTIQRWDDGRTITDGIIQGGNGVWNNADKTWSSTDGFSKNRWNGNVAIFDGHAGTIDVQDNISFQKLEFITNGYTIRSSNNSKLLVNGPATLKVDNTDQADISAEITGTGSISKTGTGTLILSHDNSYTGGFVNNEGTLVVHTPKALPGRLTLQSGELHFGNTNTLEVENYIQNKDAILTLRANSPTNHDQLVVNTSAYLGGTLVVSINKPSSLPDPGQMIPIITSKSKGLNGRFDNIQAQASIKMPQVNYSPKEVYLTSQYAPIYPYARSKNAQALTLPLDLVSNTGQAGQGIRTLLNTLADLPLTQISDALERLVPYPVFALSSTGFSVSRSQMHNLQGRLEELTSGVSYGQLNTSAPQPHELPSPETLTQTIFLMNTDQAQNRWNFYMRGNGSFGRQKDNEANGNEVIGYDYGQGGTFIGADYCLNPKIYVGGALSYTYTDASFHGDRGSLSTDSYFAHLYAAYVQPKGFNLISSLSLGDHEFDLRRRALTDTARSQPQSREVDFQSQVSYNILVKPNLTVSPYAALTYSTFWMSGFQEHNSQASFKISDDQTNSLQSTIGVKAQYEKFFTRGIPKASVEAYMAWDHEYFDAQSRGINAEWIGSRVPSFWVQGGRIDPDTLISGVNLRLSVTNQLSVIIGYNFAANQDYISHSFSAGVDLTF